MIEWIDDTIRKYPRFSNIFMFNVLTGLRHSEAIKSFNLLLSDKRSIYFSEDCKRLEHFKFSDLFLRRTKKAFISVINDDILNLLFYGFEILTYDKIQLTFQRDNKEFYMAYCRKIFATFLRNEGVEPEILDLLRERIRSSVFANHYYRPDIHDIITKRIRPVRGLLLKELT